MEAQLENILSGKVVEKLKEYQKNQVQEELCSLVDFLEKEVLASDVLSKDNEVLRLRENLDSKAFKAFVYSYIVLFVDANCDQIKKQQINDLVFSHFSNGELRKDLRKLVNDLSKSDIFNENINSLVQNKDIIFQESKNKINKLLKNSKDFRGSKKFFYYFFTSLFESIIQSQTKIFLEEDIDLKDVEIDFKIDQQGNYVYNCDKKKIENFLENNFGGSLDKFYDISSIDKGYKVIDKATNIQIKFLSEDKVLTQLEEKFKNNSTFSREKIDIILEVCDDIGVKYFEKSVDKDLDFNKKLREVLKGNQSEFYKKLVSNWPYLGLQRLQKGDEIRNIIFHNIKKLNSECGKLFADQILDRAKDKIEKKLDNESGKVIRRNYKNLTFGLDPLYDIIDVDEVARRTKTVFDQIDDDIIINFLFENVVCRDLLLEKDGNKVNLTDYISSNLIQDKKIIRNKNLDEWIQAHKGLWQKVKENLMEQEEKYDFDKAIKNRKEHILDILDWNIGYTQVESNDNKQKLINFFQAERAGEIARIQEKKGHSQIKNKYSTYQENEIIKYREKVEQLKNKWNDEKICLEQGCLQVIKQTEQSEVGWKFNKLLMKKIKLYDKKEFVSWLKNHGQNIDEKKCIELYRDMQFEIEYMNACADWIKDGVYENIDNDFEKTKQIDESIASINQSLDKNKRINPKDIKVCANSLKYNQKGLMTRQALKEYVAEQSTGTLVFGDIQSMGGENRQDFLKVMEKAIDVENDKINYDKLLRAGDSITKKLMNVVWWLYDKYKDQIKIARGGDEIYMYVDGQFDKDEFYKKINQEGLNIRVVTSKVQSDTDIVGVHKEIDSMDQFSEISKILENKIHILNEKYNLSLSTDSIIDRQGLSIAKLNEYKEQIKNFMSKDRFFDVRLLDLYEGSVDYIPLSNDFYLAKNGEKLAIEYISEPLDMTEGKLYFEFHNLLEFLELDSLEMQKLDKKINAYIEKVKNIKVQKLKYLRNNEKNFNEYRNQIEELRNDLVNDKNLQFQGKKFFNYILDEVIEYSKTGIENINKLMDKLGGVSKKASSIETLQKNQVPLKTRESSFRKLYFDNDCDLSKNLSDILRGSVIYESIDELQKGVDKLKQIAKSKDWIISYKNRLKEPTACDHRFQIKDNEGYIYEIQLHLKELYQFKNKGVDVDQYQLYISKFPLERAKKLLNRFQNLFPKQEMSREYEKDIKDLINKFKNLISKFDNLEGKIKAGELYKIRKRLKKQFGKIARQIGADWKEDIDVIVDSLERIEANINDFIKIQNYESMFFEKGQVYKQGEQKIIKFKGMFFQTEGKSVKRVLGKRIEDMEHIGNMNVLEKSLKSKVRKKIIEEKNIYKKHKESMQDLMEKLKLNNGFDKLLTSCVFESLLMYVDLEENEKVKQKIIKYIYSVDESLEKYIENMDSNIKNELKTKTQDLYLHMEESWQYDPYGLLKKIYDNFKKYIRKKVDGHNLKKDKNKFKSFLAEKKNKAFKKVEKSVEDKY